MVEHFQGLSNRQWCGWLVGGHKRPQQPVVDFGVEHGEPLPVVGEDVGVGMLKPDDRAFELEAPARRPADSARTR